MYQVVEHAGSDRERVVAGPFSTFHKALLYELYSYTDEAAEELYQVAIHGVKKI